VGQRRAHAGLMVLLVMDVFPLQVLFMVGLRPSR
jgi:Mg2+/citrate symporter